MENENQTQEPRVSQEESSKQSSQKISTPIAIVIAGLLIMIGVIVSGGAKDTKDKTLSEQVGVSKAKLTECIGKTDQNALAQKLQTSVESAMKAIPQEQRGTPYAVIVGNNGVKTEIRGADSVDSVKKLITEVTSGTVTAKYEGEVPPVDATDHVMGNPSTATVTIIEYSDFECPYCKAFQATLKQVVTESNGSVAWVYRHWPIHSGSFEKLVAAECVAQIKGNDAFWKYSDLLFGLLQTTNNTATEKL